MVTLTPGEWKFDPQSGRVDSEETHEPVAYISAFTKEAHGNGYAIAAVPKMLRALRSTHQHIVGLKAYLATCATDVIIDNLESTIAALRKQVEEAEAAIREAEGEGN